VSQIGVRPLAVIFGPKQCCQCLALVALTGYSQVNQEGDGFVTIYF
jgi:hypothetical protein